MKEQPTTTTASNRGPTLRLDTSDRLAVARESVAVPRSPDPIYAPLSCGQRGLWWIDRFSEGAVAYHLARSLRIKGPLDAAAVYKAVESIIARHEILRTTFVDRHGEPIQVIWPEVKPPVYMIDISGLNGAETEQEIKRIAVQQQQRRFDVTRAPLFMLSVIQVTDDDHALILLMHHIISDGWSLGILQREFAAFYNAFQSRETPLLQPLQQQYRDYAMRQLQWLASPEAVPLTEYWKRTLDGVQPLALPMDRPRPARRSFRGASVYTRVPAEMAAALKKLSRSHGVTLFMTLASTLTALLARYSGQDDIVIGSPVAGRDRPELEGVLGPFVNLVPLRIRVGRDLTIRELFQVVRQVCLGAYAHQDLPFEHLVETLMMSRDSSMHPLFQVVLVLQNANPGEKSGLSEVRGTEVVTDTSYAKFDMWWSVVDSSQGIGIFLEYSTDVFERETAEQMLNGYLKVLESVVADSDRRIGHLEVMSESERRRILEVWNETGRNYDEPQNLTALVEAQAEQSPEAVAVVWEGGAWSYRELNGRANRIAQLLRERYGIHGESRVGVCMERGPDLVASLLGVLKAGAAYVPLDPRYPTERLEWMVSDSQVAIVLAGRDTAGAVRGLGAAVAEVDSPKWGGQAARNLGVRIYPEQAAYVIYTSGSTGKPKGAVNTHLNVVRLVNATQHWFNFSDQDTWTLFHSATFDFSVWEWAGALCNGGRLVIVPYLVTRDPNRFVGWVHEHRVTVLNQTPTAFQQFITADEQSNRYDLPLRLIILGGEALNIRNLSGWLDRHGDERPQIFNMYGITETTVHVTCQRITRDQILERRGSSIGRPIPDLQVYVVDNWGQIAPFGVVGEICVAGRGLARGYVNQPAMTAQRFIPDPFGSRPGERLYRTGDLGYYLPNGTLQFVGRADRQVKIRGHRIELAEIEAALVAHASVADAIVLVRNEKESLSLAAFVKSRPRTQLDRSSVRRWIEDRLPTYMVPASLQVVQDWPLTRNGKVDTDALLRLADPIPSRHMEPRTDAERTLAEIWRLVLRRPRVGIDDDFFAIGGDSIISVRIAAEAQAQGLPLGIADLFTYRTIRHTCTALGLSSHEPGQAGSKHSVQAQKTATRADLEFPLSPIQRYCVARRNELADSRLWYLYEVDEFSGRALDQTSFERAWQKVIKRHHCLRSNVTSGPPESARLVVTSAHSSVPLVDLSTKLPSEAERIISDHVTHQIQQHTSPVAESHVAVRLFRLAEKQYRLFWGRNYMLLDGWSSAVVLNEVLTCYDALCSGRAPLLDPVCPYSAYADWLAKKDPARDLEFWLDYLNRYSEAATLASLIHDTGLPPGYATYKLSFPADLSSSLRMIQTRLGVTVSTIFEGAWSLALSVGLNSPTILYGFVSAGRPPEVQGITKVVGGLNNLLPALVTCVSRDPLISWLFKLQEVRTRMREHDTTSLLDIRDSLGTKSFGAGLDHYLTFENFPTGQHLRQKLTEYNVRSIEGNMFAEQALRIQAWPTNRLFFSFTYRQNMLHSSTIALLAELFDAILKVIAHNHTVSVDRTLKDLRRTSAALELARHRVG